MLPRRRWIIYTLHTSRCLCVGFPRSPQSLTSVSSWGFTASPRDSPLRDSPFQGQRKRCSKRLTVLSCNSNYFGYIFNYQ
ncbi:hypothetical protein F8562_19535 [Klebsiella sp. RCJ4]|nr:hypothetical protein F8562_19535 [Klebsiella sp. RCJ4]